jgi:uncharacterized protein
MSHTTVSVVLPAPGKPAPAPVSPSERLASVDVLRGVALLGILSINIWIFGLPELVLYVPSAWGGFSGLDRFAWLTTYLLCEQKMMSIFSLLFGAGLVLMDGRARARGTSLAGVYYRRVFWLLVIGLLHAYLLWDGDILVSYALCGFLLYPFRRLRPAWLISLGIVVFLLAIPFTAGLGLLAQWSRDVTGPDGRGGTPWQREIRAAIDDSLPEQPDQKKLQEEIDVHRGGYGPLFVWRARNNAELQTAGFVVWAGPRAGGLMLIGMGLMQLGVFAAARSYRFYLCLVALGYGLGFPLVAWGVHRLLAHDFDMVQEMTIDGQFNYAGSLFVALGHVGVVMLICKAGLLPWLRGRLAAVGRMALTNYLAQTLICTALFDGWGLGLYGRLGRVQLLGVVACVWLVELAWSAPWLRHFRYGPAEWLWRSLTYWRWIPLRGPLVVEAGVLSTDPMAAGPLETNEEVQGAFYEKI